MIERKESSINSIWYRSILKSGVSGDIIRHLKTCCAIS